MAVRRTPDIPSNHRRQLLPIGGTATFRPCGRQLTWAAFHGNNPGEGLAGPTLPRCDLWPPCPGLVQTSSWRVNVYDQAHARHMRGFSDFALMVDCCRIAKDYRP